MQLPSLSTSLRSWLTLTRCLHLTLTQQASYLHLALTQQASYLHLTLTHT